MRQQRDIAAAGFADLLDPGDPPPALSAHAALALRCWAWCKGWQPERWPLWGALNRVPDWDLLLHLLQTLDHALTTADRQAAAATPPP